MRHSLIIFLFGLCLIFSENSFSQISSNEKKSNFFSTTHEKYYRDVIEPWRYDFLKKVKINYSDKAIGKLTFWRSKELVDYKSGKKWTPNISFDVFILTDMPDLKSLSDSVKHVSNCDSINIGGDIIIVGHFALFNSSACIECALDSKVDYCRNFVKRFLNSATNRETMDFEIILDQLEIRKKKFKY